MGRSKNGQAVRGERRSRAERRRLSRLLAEAKRREDLATWRRAKAVLGYIGGKSVIELSDELDVTRGSINRWLQWFQAQGTGLQQTWARVGEQPRVDTYGERKTAPIFGAISLKDARFTYQFADVFNGITFWGFLRLLVRRYESRKIFLIIDNGPCHNLDENGKRWLGENRRHISLHRLPPYSPEFNPIEPVWKTTRKLATHNRFYQTIIERDPALRRTFQRFNANPALISAHVARFQ